MRMAADQGFNYGLAHLVDKLRHPELRRGRLLAILVP